MAASPSEWCRIKLASAQEDVRQLAQGRSSGNNDFQWVT